MQLKHGVQLAKPNWIRFLFCRKGLCDFMTSDKYSTVYGPLISSDPIFIELEMLKVSYKYQVSKLIFKCINKMAPVNFHNWFKINHGRHGYSTTSNIILMLALK